MSSGFSRACSDQSGVLPISPLGLVQIVELSWCLRIPILVQHVVKKLTCAMRGVPPLQGSPPGAQELAMEEARTAWHPQSTERRRIRQTNKKAPCLLLFFFAALFLSSQGQGRSRRAFPRSCRQFPEVRHVHALLQAQTLHRGGGHVQIVELSWSLRKLFSPQPKQHPIHPKPLGALGLPMELPALEVAFSSSACHISSTTPLIQQGFVTCWPRHSHTNRLHPPSACSPPPPASTTSPLATAAPPPRPQCTPPLNRCRSRGAHFCAHP